MIGDSIDRLTERKKQCESTLTAPDPFNRIRMAVGQPALDAMRLTLSDRTYRCIKYLDSETLTHSGKHHAPTYEWDDEGNHQTAT